MSKKKKTSATRAIARIERPSKAYNGEELVTLTRQSVVGITAATGYSTAPAVQSAVSAVTTATDGYELTLSRIAQTRSALALLLATRDTEHEAVLRERDNLESAVTAAAKGSPDAIRAWSCLVQAKTPAVSTDEAPMHLVLKNSPTTPGMVSAKCKGVKGAGSYVFVFSADPNAAPGVGQTVAVTASKCTITGQPLGHVLYARVAVIRKVGGQSQWSGPIQLLVR